MAYGMYWYSDGESKRLLNIDLLSANRKNKLDKVKQHLDSGADVNVKDANNKNNTPLHYAVKNANKGIAKLF
jgi:ankyrin repeat protein